MMETKKDRMIFESVPGKQVTLAHIIANPGKRVFQRVGIEDNGTSAIGLMTVTPSDVSIIASDIMRKASDVNLAFLDRFSGAVCVTGDISAVEHAVKEAQKFLGSTLRFSTCKVTRT